MFGVGSHSDEVSIPWDRSFQYAPSVHARDSGIDQLVPLSER